ncbi:hypothetical protein RIU21_07280 [Riemerella anatipestifer]|uniref:hypothetical protein n=1 Tax=Riemerella anatipestifer TaxID=34085 RepID=UPI0028549981|nr:hypothetical protein [Riemerella anatipestifer]MDR7846567.1 hypothetical protein [Riemerella anatipestifer]
MTTQDKLQAITADIRQKLPRLMELDEGCLIRDKEIDVIYTIIEKDDKFQLLFVNGNNCFSFDFFKSRFEVIGKEPMLTDVLEWLNLLKEVSLCYLDHLVIFVQTKSDKFYFQEIDITKPYLKDQSKEVIDFLYNLIENEKITK